MPQITRGKRFRDAGNIFSFFTAFEDISDKKTKRSHYVIQKCQAIGKPEELPVRGAGSQGDPAKISQPVQ
jgi:hypothetical protein